MKNTLTNEELRNELTSAEIDEAIETFINDRTYENFVALGHAINKFGIITCAQLIFKDSDLENELKEEGYLPPEVILDDNKVLLNHLLIENNDHEVWFPIFTNKDQIEERIFENNNCIMKTTFMKAYEDFKTCPYDLCGIIINPYTDHIHLVPDLCEFISTDCDESLLEDSDEDDNMKN